MLGDFSIKPGIAVIIFDEKKRILLQLRSDVKQWGIPSGNVEPGETIEEAAIREMKEEANVSIQIQKLIGVYSEPQSQLFHYPNGKSVHFITSCFLAKIVEGEVTTHSEESLDMKFFPINELPDNLLPMHPMWLKDALADKEKAFIR
jgi:ADP-ribose pyrophosphatase YjhB (NUDIX family)